MKEEERINTNWKDNTNWDKNNKGTNVGGHLKTWIAVTKVSLIARTKYTFVYNISDQ